MALSAVQSLLGKILEAANFSGSTSTATSSIQPPNQAAGLEALRSLSRTLRMMQAVQQDAEEREIHDRSVRLWLTELRGVAYQAEDVLDEFHYEVLRAVVEAGDASIETYHKGTKRKLQEMYASPSLDSSSPTVPKISIPDGMAEKIESITKRFEEISKWRTHLHLREDDGTRIFGPESRQPTSSHHENESSIYGRENEKEEIIRSLDPSSGPNFMVLPIVGMGGLGKTTLAQLIYNDSKFNQLFQKRAWVSVSEDFDLVRLTRATIESISGTCCALSELNTLQDVLKKWVKDCSLFLVLDDVWNEKKNLWERFRVFFNGTKTVRILTTTRNSYVAEVMQTVTHFKLGFLPQEKCWLLFKYFAFDNRESSEHENLIKIGQDIVKKCKGSPLAIKVLGGLLRYDMDEEKWSEVLERDLSEIDETDEIFLALKLSYQKLPLYLRPCFLYLSMFPKGQLLDKAKVIRLWMAQGYIHAKSNETLEEIGVQYLNELHCRSLVDYTSNTRDNDPILHDLVHDMAKSISEGATLEWEYDQPWNSLFKVQHLHLAGQTGLPEFLTPCNYSSVRTLLNYHSNDQSTLFYTFSRIPCVRAFGINLSHPEFPDVIGSLKHLRYLCITGSMNMLPESICVLYNLQTLDVSSNLRELPENIKSLVNLRYMRLSSLQIEQLPESISLLRNMQELYLDGCSYLKALPRGLDQLTNLHILKLPACFSDVNMPFRFGKLLHIRTLVGYFHVSGDEMIRGLGEIKDLNKLSGILRISGLKNITNVEFSKKANLSSKPGLRFLILNFENDSSTVSFRNQLLHLDVRTSNGITQVENKEIQQKLLESLRPHVNIIHIQILGLSGRSIPSWLLDLSSLSKLTTLRLNFCTDPTSLPQFGQLAHLTFLEISGSTSARNVGNGFSTYLVLATDSKQPGKVDFPSLKHLLLKNMLNFREWQACAGDLPCLEELAISNCPQLRKIANVPQKVKWLRLSNCGFQEIKFSLQSNIKSISTSDCKELVNIDCTNVAIDTLESISFTKCPKLCKFSTIPNKVKDLCIEDCGFEKIEMLPDSKIKRISISNCRELMAIYCKIRDLPISGSTSPFDTTPVGISMGNPEESRETPNEIQFLQQCSIAKAFHILHWPELISADISHCPKLSSLHFLEGNTPSLEQLSIKYCPQIQAVLTIPSELKKLTIIECGISGICLPPESKLHELIITSCAELTSIKALHGQHFLANLNVSHCPLLQLSLIGLFQHMPETVIIFDCPNVEMGIGRNDFYYQRCTAPIEIKVSDEEILPRDVSSWSIPLLKDSFALLFSKEDTLDMEGMICAPLGALRGQFVVLTLTLLVKLEISRCSKVISVAGLDNLRNLKYLLISACPELCVLEDAMPSGPCFMIFHSCEKLSSLPFLSVHNNSRLILMHSSHQLADVNNIESSSQSLHAIMGYLTSAIQERMVHVCLIFNCPMIQDWCQRNSINYHEFNNLMNRPQDDGGVEHKRNQSTDVDQ